jgi:5'-nucleotidase (lipoprotein e(P4) family)
MKKNSFNLVLKSIILTICIFCVAFIGITKAQDYTIRDLHEQHLLATVWYQRSAEFKALCHQTFNMAKLIYDMDLQKGEPSMKRAVTVDINETILDNSKYMAGLVDNDQGFPTGWNEWCLSGKREAVPGSVDFLNYVVSKGGDVFYISNTRIKHKDRTMKTLKALGFPQIEDDHVLLREQTSNKEPRREMVRKTHKIVVFIGDNLNDLDNIFRKKSLGQRRTAVDQVKDQFGIKYFVVPNPYYGEWEVGAYKGNWELSPMEKSKARKAALIKWNMK